MIKDWTAARDLDYVSLTIDDFCIKFMNHAEKYYRRQDGTPTSEAQCMRNALKFVIQYHRVRAFGIRAKRN